MFFGACVADGYNLMTKFPVNSLEDLKGKKIVGAAAVAPLIKALGAAAVVGALPTFYSQLNRRRRRRGHSRNGSMAAQAA